MMAAMPMIVGKAEPRFEVEVDEDCELMGHPPATVLNCTLSLFNLQQDFIPITACKYFTHFI